VLLYPEDTVSIFSNMLVPVCDITDFTWHKTMTFILTAGRMSHLTSTYEVCSNSIWIGIVVVVHWVGCVCNQS